MNKEKEPNELIKEAIKILMDEQKEHVCNHIIKIIDGHIKAHKEISTEKDDYKIVCEIAVDTLERLKDSINKLT